MDLRTVTRSVQEQLVASAAVGDDSTRRAAELLSISLEPALRLALQEALEQVAAEVSADLAPGRVDVSLRGGELALTVVPPSAAAADPPPAPAPPGGPEESEADPEADAATARVTFRPPRSLKARLERAATEESLSLNTYLIRALTAHLDRPARPAPSSHGAGRTSGWFL